MPPTSPQVDASVASLCALFDDLAASRAAIAAATDHDAGVVLGAILRECAEAVEADPYLDRRQREALMAHARALLLDSAA
jgi:hypothetical protein